MLFLFSFKKDELLLLRKGGQVVYHGPLHDKNATSDENKMVSYFEHFGAPKISLGENPANWMLRVLACESLGDLAEKYVQSKEFAALKAELKSVKEDTSDDLKLSFKSEFAVPVNRRREIINGRLRLIYWRSPAYNLTRISVSVMIAFILGSVFIFQRAQDISSEVDMQARLSVIFLSFIITGIMAMLAVLPGNLVMS